MSADTAGRPGWAYYSQAECLVYYVPSAGRIYVIRLAVMRRLLSQWAQCYPQALREGHLTRGILVPLVELGAHAEAAIDIVEGTTQGR
jgi:hypothetical protein